MKCENCGANLVNGKCEYCGYQIKKEDKQRVNIYVDKTNAQKRYVQYNNPSKKNIGLQIFLWLFFWYVMIFVVIIKSEKLSKKTKIILCSIIGFVFVLIGITGDSSSYDVDTTKTYSVGTEVLSGDYEILLSDYDIEKAEDHNVLIVNFEIKYIGDRYGGVTTSIALEYKLRDADGLVFERDYVYETNLNKMIYKLETGDKGIGQMAFKLENEITEDLIFYIYSDVYYTDCDVKYVLPKEELEKMMP